MEAANEPIIRHVGENDYTSECLFCGEVVAPHCGQLFVDERYDTVFAIHDADCLPRPEILDKGKSMMKRRDRNTLLGLLPWVVVLAIVIMVLAP